MRINRFRVIGAGLFACLAGAPVQAAEPMPALVSAYADQLARQCGPLAPGTSAAGMIEHVDLDGDKIDDWVVDAARYPCPARPVGQFGAQITIFRGFPNGIASPVFQRAAFGSRLLRPADGPPTFWVTLGGSDCGAATAAERCERKVVWDPRGGRFEAVDPAVKAKRP